MSTRFDIENQLSVAQAFTTGPAVSTHSYKKQTAAQDLSIGRRMAMLILPVVAAGAATVATIELIQATDAALTAGIDSLASVTVLAANLTLGDQVELPCPQGVMNKQYIGIRVTLAGGVETFTCDAYFVPQDEIAQYKSFPKVNNAQVQ